VINPFNIAHICFGFFTLTDDKINMSYATVQYGKKYNFQLYNTKKNRLLVVQYGKKCLVTCHKLMFLIRLEL
jgi:hypothetical protein